MKIKKIWKIIFILAVLSSGTYFTYKLVDKKDIKSEEKKNTNTVKIADNTNYANITLFGDLLFEQPYYDAVNKGEDINNYFEEINTKYFKNDDITIGNMEVPISDGTLSVSGDGYSFCAPTKVGEMISKKSIEVLSTANNHSFDRGIKGIDSTIDFFKNNSNIVTVGTYKDSEDRKDLRIIEKNGIKFGFVAYTSFTNIAVSKESRNKVGLWRDPDTSPKMLTEEYKELITREINEIRDKVDVLVAIVHWGSEFTYKEREDQVEFAQFLADLNVDIISGSHSHCIQPIKWFTGKNGNKTLVHYSLGNFVSADTDLDRTTNDETFDNAYHVGLISNINIKKVDNKIQIEGIKTEPIINYYDKSISNFKIIPLSSYTEDIEKNHYRYNKGLTIDFIKSSYESVIDSEFR